MSSVAGDVQTGPAAMSRPIRWRKTINRFALFMSGSRGLGIVALPVPGTRRYNVAAFETSTACKSVDDVLANHSHENLGQVRNLAELEKLTQRYVRKWRKNRRTLAAKCTCGPIITAAPPELTREGISA